VGRLEDIIERNRDPRAHRRGLSTSVMIGLFLLLVLALMMFTDLGLSDEAKNARDDAPPRRPGHSVPVHLGAPK
jgi:hypothetical protein